MRFLSIVLLFVVVAMANASDTKKVYYDVADAEKHFAEFMQTHNRQYKDDADREVHFQAFKANLEKINKMNEQNPSATYGINKFADYTEEERQSMFGHGIRKPQ